MRVPDWQAKIHAAQFRRDNPAMGRSIFVKAARRLFALSAVNDVRCAEKFMSDARSFRGRAQLRPAASGAGPCDNLFLPTVPCKSSCRGWFRGR